MATIYLNTNNRKLYLSMLREITSADRRLNWKRIDD